MRVLIVGLLLVACSSPTEPSGVVADSMPSEAGARSTDDAVPSAGAAAATMTGAAAIDEASAGQSAAVAGASNAGAGGVAPPFGAEAGAPAGGQSGNATGGRGGGTSGGATSTGGGGTASSDQGGRPPACVPTTWYADLDRDAFGDAAQHTSACDAPHGYVADATDCDDTNPDVHPGQLDWFESARGDGSFDYDCSGSDELRYPTFSQCPELDNSCPPPNRWPAGFTCDYEGMFAPYRADDGWRLYTANICPYEYCGTAAVKLPACGESGHYGKPPIGWDVGTSAYTCEPMPFLYDEKIARLPLRTQTCH